MDALDISQRWPLPFTQEDWEKTPHTVRLYILALEHQIGEQKKTLETLMKRVDELEARLNRNSSISNQPPFSENQLKDFRSGAWESAHLEFAKAVSLKLWLQMLGTS